MFGQRGEECSSATLEHKNTHHKWVHDKRPDERHASTSLGSLIFASLSHQPFYSRRASDLASPALESNSDHIGSLNTLLARLKSERERLLRLYSDQDRLASVLAAEHAACQAEIVRARMDTMKRAALGQAATQIQKRTRPFGTPDSAPGTQDFGQSRTKAAVGASTQDCGSCGLEYSIGGRP